MDSMRKMLLPVDGRGKRGIYSRGKAQYPGMLNEPNPPSWQTLAKRRLMNRGNRTGITKRPIA